MKDLWLVIAVAANLLGLVAALVFVVSVRGMLRQLRHERDVARALLGWYEPSCTFWRKMFETVNQDRLPRPLTDLEVADMRIIWERGEAEGEDKIRFS